jgi:hypothetical protein
MTEEKALAFKILVKEEQSMVIAHCLELDLVATADTEDQAVKDIFDLIRAQVEYAFNNDNLDHLLHAAPVEIWEEFYKSKEPVIHRYEVTGTLTDPGAFIPPWIAQARKAKPSKHV